MPLITADLPATPHGMGPSLEASVSHEMEKNEWWAVTGSNRRPSRCKRDALPAELTALIFLRCKEFIQAPGRFSYTALAKPASSFSQ